MHGFTADLPLSCFVGKEANQLGLGRFQVTLTFSGTGSINVLGPWQLRDAGGALIDESCEHAKRDCFRLHAIIDVPVVGFEVDPPRSFTLVFDSGHRLTVIDDTPQYEACAIHRDGQPDIYI